MERLRGLPRVKLWAGYGDQSDPTNGLLIIALDRKVEYTLDASIETYIGGQLERVDGDLVFAYSTGDMGYFSLTIHWTPWTTALTVLTMMVMVG